MKIWNFTAIKFFWLIVISHAALFFVLYAGTVGHYIALFICYLLTYLVGSTVTFHRLITHRSFEAPRWFVIFGTICGIFGFNGTPISRAILHRMHHAYTDKTGDPHSPWVNGLFYTYFPMLKEVKVDLRLGSDLYKDKFYRFTHDYYLLIISATVILSAAIIGPLWTATLFLAPGALTWFTNAVCNIFCHLGDDPEYRVVDSRILAILTWGDGWHGHHHKNPADPDPGQGRYDPAYFIIKLVQKKHK